MNSRALYIMFFVALGAVSARSDGPPGRPDLSSAEPIAECKLQTLRAAATPTYEQPAVLYTLQRPAEDPLANYERTPLGDWQMPADAQRDDPWLRVLLVGPKRPIIIDLAVFIDGKSFRDKREAWVDEVLATAKSKTADTAGDIERGNNEDPAAGTKRQDADSAAESRDSAGTITAEKTSESGLSAGSKDENPEGNGEKKLPSVAAKARQAPTMRDRLINYLATNGDMVERDEIHWLLAEWGAGPAVVVLSASFSWQRASLAPLLAYLDQDADGSLSAGEIAQADNLWKRADVDANDVVEVSELRRVTNRPLASPKAAGHSLIVPLDGNTDWDALAANMLRIYGGQAGTPAPQSSASITERIAQGDSSIDGKQLRQLVEAPADVVFRVDFGPGARENNEANGVSVVSIGSNLAASSESVKAASHVISVDVLGDFLEFSAAQAPADDKVDTGASQLAIGAVIDGNPIERLLDGDQDGRFTLRERQELSGLLAALDRDEDGELSNVEIPVPIRLAVTRGPQVHQLLASPTGSARSIAPRDAAPAPPDWFVSMDKNSDHDLSRGEFLGTSEQFRQFDADADGLLSVAEALKLNGNQ